MYSIYPRATYIEMNCKLELCFSKFNKLHDYNIKFICIVISLSRSAFYYNDGLYASSIKSYRRRLREEIIEVIREQNHHAIKISRLIEWKKQQPNCSNEYFDNQIQIEENAQVAIRCVSGEFTEICGKNEYITACYKIRPRIERALSSWMFLGINFKSAPLQRQSCYSISSYGWSCNNYYWSNGQPENPETLVLCESLDNHLFFVVVWKMYYHCEIVARYRVQLFGPGYKKKCRFRSGCEKLYPCRTLDKSQSYLDYFSHIYSVTLSLCWFRRKALYLSLTLSNSANI
jgi:hypothetical protein